MGICTIEINDEVNVKLLGLDVTTKRVLTNAVRFFIPSAKYSPLYKSGVWDGYTSFCDIGGRTYINLLDTLIPKVLEAGYQVSVDDKRTKFSFDLKSIDKNSYSHIMWPEGHPLARQPIVLRDYQVEVVNSFLNTHQGINVCPTAAGKTIITAILSNKVEPYGRSIVIVPTRDLVTQTEQDYRNLDLDVGVLYGGRREFGKTHTICTWQSLESLAKLKDGTIERFTKGVVCVITDETHRAKGSVLQKLLTKHFSHVPLRWGLTGTLPKENIDRMALLIGVGPIINVIKTKTLQEKGFLANLHIHVKQFQDDKGDRLIGDYQEEIEWLSTDMNRLQHLAKMLEEIRQSGNTLVLIERKKTGKLLSTLIPNSVYINGDTKSELRLAEYKEAQTVDNKLIIATSGVASTGININRLFNLVLFESGKSFVKVIQSIGRGLRVAEDKEFVDVYDICSSCDFSKKHLTERKKYYKEAEYPFSIEHIKYIEGI